MASSDITKRTIADTMKRLMCQKPLAKISVGDIVETCHINRNSFYYHFKDKYDLVNWIFYTELTGHLSGKDAFTVSLWTLIEDICTFFYNDKAFYQNALSVSGQNSLSEYFLDLFRAVVKTRTEMLFEDEELQDFCAVFCADAFVSTIFRWLAGGAKTPPERITELIRRSIHGTVAQLLSEEDLPRPAGDTAVD